MKILKRILIALFVVFLMLWLGVAFALEPVMKSKLQAHLCKHQSDTIYIGSLEISFWPLGAKATDVYFNLKIPKDTVMSTIQGNLDLAEISGIDWKSGLKNNKWNAENIEVKSGGILWNTLKEKNDKEGPKVAKPKATIFVSNVAVADIDLQITGAAYDVGLHTSIQIKGLAHVPTDSIPWIIAQLKLSSKDGAFSNIEKDVNFGYGQLDYDSEKRLLTVENFEFKPEATKEDFTQQELYRKAYIAITAKTISVEGFDIMEIHNGLFIDKLSLDSTHFEIFIDLRKNLSPVVKPLPVQMVSRLTIPINIDSILLKNSSLDYSHQAVHEGRGLGLLYLENLHAAIGSISNQEEQGIADIELTGNAVMRNSAHVGVYLKCFGASKHNEFVSNISVGALPLQDFNGILFPTVGVKVRSGYCKGVNAHFTGNSFSTLGKLNMEYSDLKIAIPPDHKGELSMIQKGIEAAGNLALVNNNNSNEAKNGEIFYEHDPYEPFVGYWWKSIQSGLLDAMLFVDPTGNKKKPKNEKWHLFHKK